MQKFIKQIQVMGKPIAMQLLDVYKRQEYNSTLVIGQTIVVQFPTVVHTVKQGESLYTIAKQYGVSVISLYQNLSLIHI